MRTRLLCAASIVLLVGAIGSVSPSSATPVLPPTDYDSPYIAEIDAQLPTNIPWKEGTEQTHRAKFAKLYSVGIRWVYVWVPWTDVEIAQGVYDFTRLDNYIGWAREEGILVQLQVMTGPWSQYPSWVGPKRVNPRHPLGENVPAVDLSWAVGFWQALVRRYKPGGDLAVARGWQDGYGVRNWEVENEPAQSVLPIYASWGKIPKDFAAFLSQLYPAVKAIYPEIVIAAPALAQTDGPLLPLLGGLDGIPWLDQMLSPVQSQWQSSTYDSASTHPAGGPYIDAFSFHVDNVNVTDGSLPGRAQAVRNAMAAHSLPLQTVDPVKANAQLWYTEGGALGYASPMDNEKFAWAEQQIAGFLHGKQVDRMIFAFGTQFDIGDFPTSPIAKASTVTTRYFPRAGNVGPATFDPRVTAFKRVDPATGSWTYVLWANNVPAGQGAGAPFTVDVPLRPTTTQVDFVNSGWVTQIVNASSSLFGKSVPVTLTPAEVSPVFIIAER